MVIDTEIPDETAGCLIADVLSAPFVEKSSNIPASKYSETADI